jgi:hypothetical protein
MLRDEIVERRAQPRIEGSFPATVSGIDLSGQPFEVGTALDNLSLSGMHLYLEQPVSVDAQLATTIRFAGIEVKATGVIKRVELRDDGSFGLGVAFDSYRVLSV